MAVNTEVKARRGLLVKLRNLWRRGPNHVPAEAGPTLLPHEDLNNGYLDAPTSDRRPADGGTGQRVSYYATQVFMAQEMYAEPKAKTNTLDRDTRITNTYVAHDRLTPEPSNPQATYADLIAGQPTIDTKFLPDWLAMQPNKGLLPTYQLDPQTKQRLKFARYLIQRGTFNEGFEDTQTPAHYRTFEDYSDDDPYPPEKYLREEYE